MTSMKSHKHWKFWKNFREYALSIEPLFEHVDSVNFSRLKEALSVTPGYNQSDAPNMLAADNDADAICSFLSEYRDTALTYRSYLKEIERLVLWCIHHAKRSISDLKREHLVEYREFLLDPKPTDIWCGPRTSKYLDNDTPNPAWRPFASPLSKATSRKVISILDSFFNYLVQNNYLAGNPMAVEKRRKGKKVRSTERWLERDAILLTLKALDNALVQQKMKPFDVFRAKYIILTFFYTGLRLAELTHHTMGHFVLHEGEWFLNIIGKGDKPRKIVVVDEYLDVLVDFRQALGLNSALPEFEETTPLIPSENTKTPISDSRVWQILKIAFEYGAQLFLERPATTEEEKLSNQYKASKLRKASPHWLRHSYGTYLVKSGVPIEKVKELMGHSDISTTMLYVHIAKMDLHESVRDLSLSGD